VSNVLFFPLKAYTRYPSESELVTREEMQANIRSYIFLKLEKEPDIYWRMVKKQEIHNLFTDKIELVTIE
jgi:hypothetical protein